MVIFDLPPRLTGEGHGLELMLGFDMRSTPKFVEKPHICDMNAFQLTLDRLTR